MGLGELHFLVWDRGTPENPIGRFDRICVITFEQGGFDTEHTNVDAFIDKGKDCRKTWDEWSAARKVTIEILEKSDSTDLGKLMIIIVGSVAMVLFGISLGVVLLNLTVQRRWPVSAALFVRIC